MESGAKPKLRSVQTEVNAPERTHLSELRRRLSFAPHNNELRLHLAQWLAEHGRRREALQELRTLVQLDPNHLVARKLREELVQSPESADSPSSPSSEALH